MIGVMVLAGHGRWMGKKKQLKSWEEVHEVLCSQGNELIDKLLDIDCLSTGHKLQHELRWEESAAATRGLDLEEAHRKAPNPVKVLLQWLEASRLVHQISAELKNEQTEEKGRKESAAASRIQRQRRVSAECKVLAAAPFSFRDRHCQRLASPRRTALRSPLLCTLRSPESASSVTLLCLHAGRPSAPRGFRPSSADRG